VVPGELAKSSPSPGGRNPSKLLVDESREMQATHGAPEALSFLPGDGRSARFTEAMRSCAICAILALVGASIRSIFRTFRGR
jgi:hypothetical protein